MAVILIVLVMVELIDGTGVGDENGDIIDMETFVHQSRCVND